MLKEGEHIDDLHRNGYVIIQDKDRFCFGTDAVLLSEFAKIGKKDKVLDLGCGNGILPILLCARNKKCESALPHFTGLEIQEDSIDLAMRSIELNVLKDRISIKQGDIKDVANIFKGQKFDVVVSNPPYIKSETPNISDHKAIARHERLCTLEDVAKAATTVLKFSGSFFMVHRPTRIVDIITVLRDYQLEPKLIRFVHATADKEPKLVLIKATKGGRPMCKVLPPLIMYKDDGTYTDEVHNIYYGD